MCYNKRDMQCIIDDAEGNILNDGVYDDCVVSGGDVTGSNRFKTLLLVLLLRLLNPLISLPFSNLSTG